MTTANEALRDALIEARETIKALHGPIAWDIYDKNAPEMKRLNAAIKAALSAPPPAAAPQSGQWRKKPVVIDAWRFDGWDAYDNEAPDWLTEAEQVFGKPRPGRVTKEVGPI